MRHLTYRYGIIVGLILFIILIIAVISTTVFPQRPTSQTIKTKIEQYEGSLTKTTQLLNKRVEQCKIAQQKFIDECAKVNKSVKEIVTELQKSESKQKTDSWFEQVQIYWLDWKDLERDVVVFSRQKGRLEKSLRNMKPLLEMLKRREENKHVYIPGEDSELDKLVAGIEVDLNIENFNKNLSVAEKTEIDIEVNNKMTKIVVSSSTTAEEKIPQKQSSTKEYPNVKITLTEEETP